MNCREAVDYIEGLAVFGSRPGFERINALLDRIGHPEKELRVVHVAGTNGKGSVCTTVANILTSAGFKTGLFTSPFVSDFRERIQIDGSFIEEEKLADLTEKIKPIVTELAEEGIQPTEFEVITAIAFLYFRDMKTDYVVLEVGLGGLLDSTNVIGTPLVSGIVSLSFDHMGVLGNTMTEIAAQKAGIIKQNGVTVCAPQNSIEAFRVIKKTAEEKNNKFIMADPSKITPIHEDINGNLIEYKGIKMTLPLIGPHQVQNLSVSLGIIEALREQGIPIPDTAVKQGVEATTVPARVEVLSKSPPIILDGGHNDDGALALSETLKAYVLPKKITLVIGVMADKEVEKVLAHLAPLASRIVTATPCNERALPAGELAKLAEKHCASVKPIDNPCDAFDFAVDVSDSDDAVVVCGSLYLAGDVRLHILDKIKHIQK